MNWNGGALARANLKRQFNDNRQNNRRNFGESRGHDENEREHREGTAPNTNPSRTQDGIPKRSRPGAPNDRLLEGHVIGRQHQDYAALGFELLKAERYERRVVPLLEFLEKKFPKGHILSLQLSHQMDITRAPSVPASSNLEASTSGNDTVNTSVFHRQGTSHDGSNINGVTNVTMNTPSSSRSSILCVESINSDSPSGVRRTSGGNARRSGAQPTGIFKIPARPRVNVGAQDIQEGGINLGNVLSRK